MIGYIKTSIDFNLLQRELDAAKALDEAGYIEEAKNVLQSMCEKLKEELK